MKLPLDLEETICMASLNNELSDHQHTRTVCLSFLYREVLGPLIFTVMMESHPLCFALFEKRHTDLGDMAPKI